MKLRSFFLAGVVIMAIAGTTPAFAETATCRDQSLNFDGTMRWWIGDTGLLFEVKRSGGNCVIDWSQPMEMVIDSSQGVIKVDGKQVGNGTAVNATGSKLELSYNAGNQSNGFAVIAVPVPEAPAPQPVVEQPAPPTDGRPLSGSCDFPDGRLNLTMDPFHSGGPRLFMDEQILTKGRALEGKKVPCHYFTPWAAKVEIAPSNQEVPAGTDNAFDALGGKSFGFAVQAHSGQDFSAAQQTGSPQVTSPSPKEITVQVIEGENPPARTMGSCDSDLGTHVDLPYFGDKRTLDMTGVLAQLRKINETQHIQCHAVNGPFTSVADANGKPNVLGPGWDIFIDTPAGFQDAFGFSVHPPR